MDNKSAKEKLSERYDDFIFEFLPNNELKKYVDKYLVDDENFVKDLDSIQGFCEKLSDKTHKEKMDILSLIVGNGARTFILKVIATKYFYKYLIKESENWLDFYWKNKAKHF